MGSWEANIKKSKKGKYSIFVGVTTSITRVVSSLSFDSRILFVTLCRCGVNSFLRHHASLRDYFHHIIFFYTPPAALFSAGNHVQQFSHEQILAAASPISIPILLRVLILFLFFDTPALLHDNNYR